MIHESTRNEHETYMKNSFTERRDDTNGRYAQKMVLIGLLTLLTPFTVIAQRQTPNRKVIHEVNQVAKPLSDHVIAIVGATLIDGTGAPAVVDTSVVIRGEHIIAVGRRSAVKIPSGADVFDAKGLTLLPGLIDSHFISMEMMVFLPCT